MTPLTKADLESGKVHAEATDLATGKIEQLTIRPGSNCHFFEPFVSGGYRICLRLDWKDTDGHGNPTLDADFYDLVTGKMDKSMKRHEAHHTSSGGHGERAYVWEFEDESRRLRVTLTRMVEMHATAKGVANISMTVIRAGDNPTNTG